MSRLRVLAVLAVVAAAGRARADGRFQVEPTRVDLSTAAPSGAVTVTNHGTTVLRLQASVYRWSEDAAGAMQLAPASDVMVRPGLFEVQPGKSRTVRVGTTAAAAATEQSYRVFIEELPDHSSTQALGVRVLTRIGVPVFVAPHSNQTALKLEPVVDDGHAGVMVSNTGTVHVKLQEIKLHAVSGTWQRTAMGWYILPGGKRRFVIDPAPPCKAGDPWIAEATSEDGARFASPPTACRQ